MKGRAGVAIGILLGAGADGFAQAPPSPPVFRSQVEAVYLDVFVTRGGQAVTGLTAADFRLRDNGVPQKLELVATESRPVLAVLVFDTSSSMEGKRLDALREAGVAFLDGLKPADQVALVAFSEEITWLAEPTADKASVREALGRLQARNATSVFDALYSAITLSDSSLRPLVVLFTDGEDNASWLDGRQLKNVVERSNTLVHVVGWKPPTDYRPGALDPGPPASEPVLREIAEASGGRFWTADSPARLRRAFAAVADAMRHRYVLRYEPQLVKREGWHRIDVRLERNVGDVEVRRGYWVAP